MREGGGVGEVMCQPESYTTPRYPPLGAIQPWFTQLGT